MAAEEEETGRPRAGYRHGPPWVFKGRQGRDLPLCPAAVRIDRCACRRRSPGQRVTPCGCCCCWRAARCTSCIW